VRESLDYRIRLIKTQPRDHLEREREGERERERERDDPPLSLSLSCKRASALSRDKHFIINSFASNASIIAARRNKRAEVCPRETSRFNDFFSPSPPPSPASRSRLPTRAKSTINNDLNNKVRARLMRAIARPIPAAAYSESYRHLVEVICWLQMREREGGGERGRERRDG